MLGNGTGGVLGNVLAAMLVHIYNFLYKPDDITSVFTEFNDYIAKLFAKGWFNLFCNADNWNWYACCILFDGVDR